MEKRLKKAWFMGHHHRNNLWITGVPKGRDGGGGQKAYSKEVMADSYPNMVRNLDNQVYEIDRLSSKQLEERHDNKTVKKSKRILKGSKEEKLVSFKEYVYQWILCRELSNQKRVRWFKVLKERTASQNTLVWQCFPTEMKERETFPDKSWRNPSPLALP